MEVGRRRPDAVERRRVVAGLRVEVGDLPVERLIEPLHVGAGELRGAGGEDPVGPHVRQRDDEVRVLPARAVGPVAARARGLEDGLPARGERRVDGARVLRRRERLHVGAHVGEVRVDGLRLRDGVDAERRRGHHDARVIAAAGGRVEHRVLLAHAPPRRHVDRHGVRRRQREERRVRPRERGHVVVREEHGGDVVGRRDADGERLGVGPDRVAACDELLQLGDLLGVAEEPLRQRGLRREVHREVVRRVAEADDDLASEDRGVAGEAVGPDDVDALVGREAREVEGDVRVRGVPPGQELALRRGAEDLRVSRVGHAAADVAFVDERVVALLRVAGALGVSGDGDWRGLARGIGLVVAAAGRGGRRRVVARRPGRRRVRRAARDGERERRGEVCERSHRLSSVPQVPAGQLPDTEVAGGAG